MQKLMCIKTQESPARVLEHSGESSRGSGAAAGRQTGRQTGRQEGRQGAGEVPSPSSGLSYVFQIIGHVEIESHIGVKSKP